MKTYKAKLIVKTPTFVGSGKQYTRLDYIKQKNVINVIDEEKFFKMLSDENLIDEFEQYAMSESSPRLSGFCEMYPEYSETIQECTSYKVGISNCKPTDISCFMRGADNKPYIPGSSIKGALRTVILTDMLNKMDSAEKRRYISGSSNLETLCNDRIMQGISVSDTTFADENSLVIYGKNDLTVNGKEKKIKLYRECMPANTELEFTISFNEKLMKDNYGNLQLNAALKSFGKYYRETYAAKFKGGMSKIPSGKSYIVFGGGSGFFGKNIVYPLYEERALRQVSMLLQKKARNHHHEKDIALGISPHCLKCTQTADSIVHFGICSIQIGDEICI